MFQIGAVFGQLFEHTVIHLESKKMRPSLLENGGWEKVKLWNTYSNQSSAKEIFELTARFSQSLDRVWGQIGTPWDVDEF